MSEVYLTHKTAITSTSYRVNCTNVSIGWKNNIFSKPNANGGEVVDVQTQSFENPVITLRGVNLVKGSTVTRDFLTYDELLTLSKVKNTPTEYLILTVNLFDTWINASAAAPSDAVLPDSAGLLGGIKVVIDSFNFDVLVEAFVTPSDDVVPGSFEKRKAIVGSIILRETA
jgi:hypothetical protein